MTVVYQNIQDPDDVVKGWKEENNAGPLVIGANQIVTATIYGEYGPWLPCSCVGFGGVDLCRPSKQKKRVMVEMLAKGVSLSVTLTDYAKSRQPTTARAVGEDMLYEYQKRFTFYAWSTATNCDNLMHIRRIHGVTQVCCDRWCAQ